MMSPAGIGKRLPVGDRRWQGRLNFEWARIPAAAMQYQELENLSNPEFKRFCGVSRATFREMVEVLRPYLDHRGRRGGQTKLSVEDQL